MLDGILPTGSALGESGGWPGPACHSELQLRVDTQDVDELAFGRGLPTGGKGEEQRQTRREGTSINFSQLEHVAVVVFFYQRAFPSCTCASLQTPVSGLLEPELHSDKDSQKYLGV